MKRSPAVEPKGGSDECDHKHSNHHASPAAVHLAQVLPVVPVSKELAKAIADYYFSQKLAQLKK